MKTLCIVLLGSVFVCSCASFAKFVYGSKKPRVEDEKSISKWVENVGLGNTEVVTVSPDEHLEKLFFLNRILTFNKEGRFLAVGYHQMKRCVLNLDREIKILRPYEQLSNVPDSFIIFQYGFVPEKIENINQLTKKEVLEKARQLAKNTVYGVDTLSVSWQTFSKALYQPDGSPYIFNIQQNYDYLLVLPFAKFEGNRIQRKELMKIIAAAKGNTYSKFKIIFLNLDKQKWWSDSSSNVSVN